MNDQKETDSEKRASIEVDSSIFYMKVTGAEGESSSEVQEVFDEEFADKIDLVKESIEEVQDKSFR